MARYVPLLALIGLTAAAPPAAAFQISTSATHSCHERITLAASDGVAWPGAATPPPRAGTDDRVLDDLPFSIPDARQDIWTASLLVGVRYNDIHGNSATDVAALVHIHNDPDDQPAHCIRSREDDGEPGDVSAARRCRDYILAEVAAAIGAGDSIDPDARTPVHVFLAFRGGVDVELSTYAFHAGRAIHALQDGFTHAFRNPDDARIRHVTNWIDWARSDDYDQAVDGHGHHGVLDDCTRSAPASQRRVTWATEASRALLAAIADDSGGRAGRLARAEAVLDQWMDVEPGCNQANGWCDAGEPAESAAGCNAGGRPGAALVLLMAAWLVARRKRIAILAVVAVLATAAPARADHVPTGGDDLGAPGAKQWGISGATSASIDRGALSIAGGGRWNPSTRFGLGLDLEYNPWFSFDANRFAPGAFNAYASFIFRWKVSRTWELRTTTHLGTSVLLFDLVGVDRGSVGLYVGISPLGVAIPLGEGIRVVVDPLGLAMPIPLVKGFPFFYRQYRFTTGIEWFL